MIKNNNNLKQAIRHRCGWSNTFAFPWEVGMFWNLTVGHDSQRAVGCPGLDEPFGSVGGPRDSGLNDPKWPYMALGSEDIYMIFGSPAMNCTVNDYALPDEKPIHEIIDDLASDNEYFAEVFLEGWQIMTSNGYSLDELEDGPQNGWFGHYSLARQETPVNGFDALDDFETFIADHAPVTFTDKCVSPLHCSK